MNTSILCKGCNSLNFNTKVYCDLCYKNRSTQNKKKIPSQLSKKAAKRQRKHQKCKETQQLNGRKDLQKREKQMIALNYKQPPKPRICEEIEPIITFKPPRRAVQKPPSPETHHIRPKINRTVILSHAPLISMAEGEEQREATQRKPTEDYIEKLTNLSMKKRPREEMMPKRPKEEEQYHDSLTKRMDVLQKQIEEMRQALHREQAQHRHTLSIQRQSSQPIAKDPTSSRHTAPRQYTYGYSSKEAAQPLRPRVTTSIITKAQLRSERQRVQVNPQNVQRYQQQVAQVAQQRLISIAPPAVFKPQQTNRPTLPTNQQSNRPTPPRTQQFNRPTPTPPPKEIMVPRFINTVPTPQPSHTLPIRTPSVIEKQRTHSLSRPMVKNTVLPSALTQQKLASTAKDTYDDFFDHSMLQHQLGNRSVVNQVPKRNVQRDSLLKETTIALPTKTFPPSTASPAPSKASPAPFKASPARSKHDPLVLRFYPIEPKETSSIPITATTQVAAKPVATRPVTTTQMASRQAPTQDIVLVDHKKFDHLGECAICSNSAVKTSLLQCQVCKSYYHRQCLQGYHTAVSDEEVEVEDDEDEEEEEEDIIDLVSSDTETEDCLSTNGEGTPTTSNFFDQFPCPECSMNDSLIDDSEVKDTDVYNTIALFQSTFRNRSTTTSELPVSKSIPSMIDDGVPISKKWKAFLDIQTANVTQDYYRITQEIEENIKQNKHYYSRGFSKLEEDNEPKERLRQCIGTAEWQKES